jgi:hypothetical protein
VDHVDFSADHLADRNLMGSTTGLTKRPYPQASELPDGPGAILLLGQRDDFINGAGIAYTLTAGTSLPAMRTSGDSFAGLAIYVVDADCYVRDNGTTFKLFRRKVFASESTRNTWTTSYSALLEVGSEALTSDTLTTWFWTGSAWSPLFVPVEGSQATALNLTATSGPVDLNTAITLPTLSFATTVELDWSTTVRLATSTIRTYTTAFVVTGAGVTVNNDVTGPVGFADIAGAAAWLQMQRAVMTIPAGISATVKLTGTPSNNGMTVAASNFHYRRHV